MLAFAVGGTYSDWDGRLLCVAASWFATRDLAFVVVAYVLGGAGFLSYQTWVRNQGLGIFGVWRGMAVYQLFRFFLFSWRVRSHTFRPLFHKKDTNEAPLVASL